MAALGLDLNELRAWRGRTRPRQWRPRPLGACFVDSLATMDVSCIGFGIRYEYGIFTQVLHRTGGRSRRPTTAFRSRRAVIPNPDRAVRVVSAVIPRRMPMTPVASDAAGSSAGACGNPTTTWCRLPQWEWNGSDRSERICLTSTAWIIRRAITRCLQFTPATRCCRRPRWPADPSGGCCGT